ncbi:MAG: hypothetical protein LBL74_00740 [Bacteroidales bacterium]|nr:hypothetical protein [Bacteroidales bacterium]
MKVFLFAHTDIVFDLIIIKCRLSIPHRNYIPTKGCFMKMKGCLVRTKGCFIFTEQPLVIVWNEARKF